jgi:hypothetical protein
MLCDGFWVLIKFPAFRLLYALPERRSGTTDPPWHPDPRHPLSKMGWISFWKLTGVDGLIFSATYISLVQEYRKRMPMNAANKLNKTFFCMAVIFDIGSIDDDQESRLITIKVQKNYLFRYSLLCSRIIPQYGHLQKWGSFLFIVKKGFRLFPEAFLRMRKLINNP